MWVSLLLTKKLEISKSLKISMKMMYTCQEWHVESDMLRATCLEWYVKSDMLRVTCWKWHVESDISTVTFWEWHVENHMNSRHVNSDMSKVTCHEWHVESDICVICSVVWCEWIGYMIYNNHINQNELHVIFCWYFPQFFF